MPHSELTGDELLAAGAILLVDRNHPEWGSMLPVPRAMSGSRDVNRQSIAVTVDSTDAVAVKVWTNRIAQIGLALRSDH